MDKLISADKLSQALRDDLNIPGREFARVKRYIEEAEDELIRCKDCKHFSPKSGYTHIDGFCYVGNTVLARIAEGYCNRGERREGE